MWCFKNSCIRNKANRDFQDEYVEDIAKTSYDKGRDLKPADFETAVKSTKFGKFNILLFVLTIPAGWSNVFATTTMSYVFPAAQCDLNLGLNEKGALNAITLLGMVTSGLTWGFLCDTLGRKKLLVFGYFLDAFLVFLSSLSQNYAMLITLKFFGGLIVNGPFTALTSYLSEFHCSAYRSRVQLMRGLIISCGNLALPLLAWGILSLNIHWSFFNDRMVIHSWNIYLFACMIPSLLSGFCFIFMPESPKFLMTVGRNDEALIVFRKVYSMNTGLSKESFPIEELVNETEFEANTKNKHGGHVTANRTKVQALKEGFQQIKPLCFPPYLINIILVCLIQSFMMISANTLRMWTPQIFQAVSDYKLKNNESNANLCTMLETLNPSPTEDPEECSFSFSPTVYRNSMIIASVSIVGFIIAATIINKIGKKKLLCALTIIAGLSSSSLYFAKNNETTLALVSIVQSLGSISGNVLVTIVIDLVPTTLRAVAISMLMMMGRSASIVGNLVFPLLLKLGCAPPFFSIGAMFFATTLFTVFLPNTELKALQ